MCKPEKTFYNNIIYQHIDLIIHLLKEIHLWRQGINPLDKTHLDVVMGLSNQEVLTRCLNKEISAERSSYNRQVKRIFSFTLSKSESMLIRQY